MKRYLSNSFALTGFFVTIVLITSGCSDGDVSVISGTSTLDFANGFDFSDNRVTTPDAELDSIGFVDCVNQTDLYLFGAPDQQTAPEFVIPINVALWANPIVKIDSAGGQPPKMEIVADPGNPSIIMLDEIELDEVIAVPLDGYAEYYFGFDSELLPYLQNIVFALKTQDSKYAIFQIVDLVNDEQGTTVTFDWKYQSDGSRFFK